MQWRAPGGLVDVAARAAQGQAVAIEDIERFAFYERAAAFAVIATGETRLYGCILVRKGVIRP